MRRLIPFLLLSVATTAVQEVSAQEVSAKPVTGNPDRRASAMVRKLTRAQKIQLVHGLMPGFLPVAQRPKGIAMGGGYVAALAEQGIPAQVATDASLGVSNLSEPRKGDVATALPSGLALASSWNESLIRDGGAMIGSEARAKGFNVMLAGGVNLVRDPRAGRNFEYLGEDPLLAGTLAGSQIAGVQSNDIISTIKHFALNDQETGRNIASVEMDEAAMRESDLLAFEIGIEKGNPGSVMCAYNRVGGIFSCENPFLLNQVLRQDWGFKGYVMSDWGAVHSTEAILHGLDQQSGEQIDPKPFFSTLLEADITSGKIPEAALDRAAQRILRTIYAHHLDTRPVSPGGAIDYDKNGLVALRAAEEGIVLLRNEGAILPLTSTARSIAVIGGHADLGVPSGGGSSQVTPVGGFKLTERTGSGIAAAFAKKAYGGTSPLDALRHMFPGATISFIDGKDPIAAAALARTVDVAIIFAEKYATEAEDHTNLSLDGNQDALIDRVADANARTIVVLEIGNPVLMPWQSKVPAILAAWYSGQRGGEAIARVLAGTVNPSGRLPVTFAASPEQLPNREVPGHDAQPIDKNTKIVYGLGQTKPFDIHYPEGSDVGYRWFDRKGYRPLYPFGFGLSYTKFEYNRLRISGGKSLTISFEVRNSGDREGADVPQVYLLRPGKAKRLIGWSKPVLAPGETRRVSVTADPRVIGDFDVKTKQWIVPAGRYGVEVATSATSALLTGSGTLARQAFKP
ncbi:MAG TPA: glycoside hydrolase family 3 C-terminal domain-containing protein [Sphingobium sp.]